ncbi:MAG: NHLP family bacteriocin export ABC transporter peptidase/permease/ATPase subunit [Acutalibacteraceae bacterium]|nr:NHLP family bacteriocin export ABC transporter peptidase/permease/ATPase subunit [Acutalibacteraceae bacterium]
MDKRIKKTFSRDIAKVPVIMQMETLECGAACLAMIMAYYNKWIPLEQLRVECGVSRNGSNAKNILIAARKYGFIASGYRYEVEELQTDKPFPCIIHWNFNHFVVLNGFKKGKAILNDPAIGTYSVSMDEFDRCYTGVCMIIEPGEQYVPEGKRKSVWDFAKERLKGAGAIIAFIVFSTLITVLMEIIRPGFSRIFMDRLLTNENPEWFNPFLRGLIIISLIEIVVSAVNAIYSNKLNGKMAVVGNTVFLWKLLHMPMEFFSQRLAGDLQHRQNSNADIAESLINIFAPIVLNLSMMIFYFVVMVRYSGILTLIGISSIMINLFLSQIIAKKRVNMTRTQMMDSAKLACTTVEGIKMIETIKASGAEDGFFRKWAGYQSRLNANKARFIRSNLYLVTLPNLISTLTTTIVTMIGVIFVFNGKFTVGMIMAFQGFLTAISAPAQSLISVGQSFTEMRTSMERVEDVMQYQDDLCYDYRSNTKGTGSYTKLTGAIEIKNVTFGYSRLAKPLIREMNISLKPGTSVAFVGVSGCGKSTIAHLLAGLYQPWSGEILFDGKPIREIERDVFTSSVAVVDQDIILFEDTIARNIKMWDESIEDFAMILAARDAQIHDEIMCREGGYRHKLTDGGREFSGGQRQCLEIARALSQDPTILILDEATSALDTKKEYEIIEAIKNRGITCITVAHRLSAIRNCDEIIVMDKGEIVERGTHEELYAKGGKYTKLIIAGCEVTNELV